MLESLPKSFTWETCSCPSSLVYKENQRPERNKFLCYHYIQVGNWASALRHSNSVWGTIILLLDIEIRTQPTLLIIQQLSQIAQLLPLGNKIGTHFANILEALPFDLDRNRLVEWRRSSLSTCIYLATSTVSVLPASRCLELVRLLGHFTSGCLIKCKLYGSLGCCDLRVLEHCGITTCFNMPLEYELHVREGEFGAKAIQCRATKQRTEVSRGRPHIALWPIQYLPFYFNENGTKCSHIKRKTFRRAMTNKHQGRELWGETLDRSLSIGHDHRDTSPIPWEAYLVLLCKQGRVGQMLLMLVYFVRHSTYIKTTKAQK